MADVGSRRGASRERGRAGRRRADGPSQTFRVFVRGTDTGIEEVTVLESADGWTLRGSGKLRAPVNLAMDYWEARYDRAWKPIELTINLTEGGRRSGPSTPRSTAPSLRATSPRKVSFSAATSTVAADTIVLPNLIFGAYEALAARLATEKVGGQLQVFIAPQDALPATIHSVTDETIKVAGRSIAARRWTLQLGGGAAKLEMEVWTEGTRLLRLDIPTQMLTVLRDDIASVSARLVTMARPNDEEVSIPANGFSLAATLSRPAAAPQPEPAPGPKARTGAAAGRRPGIGLRTDRPRRVRRGHPDLCAARQRVRRRRVSRRAVRRTRRGPERRAAGVGDDRRIRRRRARRRGVLAEAARRRSEENFAHRLRRRRMDCAARRSARAEDRGSRIDRDPVDAGHRARPRTAAAAFRATERPALPRSRRRSSSRKKFSRPSSPAKAGRISTPTYAGGSTRRCIAAF